MMCGIAGNLHEEVMQRGPFYVKFEGIKCTIIGLLFSRTLRYVVDKPRNLAKSVTVE
ncbi:hypothetical protein D3C73_619080 [compost metagenome]